MAKLYFVKELAEELRIGEYSVRSLIKKGELKAIRIGGKWRISEYEVDRFLGKPTGCAYEQCDCDAGDASDVNNEPEHEVAAAEPDAEPTVA